MGDYGPEVRKILTDNGCWFVRRGKGDHDIWRSPNAPRPFTVPQTIKSRHTANGILKDAGLPKAF
ncbi:MAG TPA: type II toxin-antitoxin system HicA family toxin [Caulobacteraceae bacterium]|nr:type II toxin-antitoxin system HicA family toxin [Caulobacteraceae bacterium]